MKYIRDLPIAEYHASDYVSHSKLQTFAEHGPLAYYARHLANQWQPKVTDAMRFGQAFETFVQRPDEFARTYKEHVDVEGKADDALLSEAQALGVLSEDGKPFTRRHAANTVHLSLMRARGEHVMTRAEMVRIERMAEAFSRNADAQAVIRGMEQQVTVRGTFAVLLGLQARPDWIDASDFGSGASVDLKVTGKWGRHDSDGADLVRALIANGADTQAAFLECTAASRADRYVIACEDDFPWRCTVVDMHELVEAAFPWVCRQLERLASCYRRDEWPACETKMVAKVPAWLARKADEDGW